MNMHVKLTKEEVREAIQNYVINNLPGMKSEKIEILPDGTVDVVVVKMSTTNHNSYDWNR